MLTITELDFDIDLLFGSKRVILYILGMPKLTDTHISLSLSLYLYPSRFSNIFGCKQLKEIRDLRFGSYYNTLFTNKGLRSSIKTPTNAGTY
jgi:hypothetical protein